MNAVDLKLLMNALCNLKLIKKYWFPFTLEDKEDQAYHSTIDDVELKVLLEANTVYFQRL